MEKKKIMLKKNSFVFFKEILNFIKKNLTIQETSNFLATKRLFED